jgi:small subunit ribosomal protein S15
MSDTKHKKEIIEKFAQDSEDTGSTQVQIALLSDRITLLTQHCKTNPKDFSTRRGLLMLVCKRRRFLDYLARKNMAGYKSIIEKLGLRR